MGFFGMTRKCVGAWAFRSRKATHWKQSNNCVQVGLCIGFLLLTES